MEILDILKGMNKDPDAVNIIAVSKTFPINDVFPLINHGHTHFGENKIQEAMEKWTDIKNDFPHIQLHMIGKLQSNKVKYAVSLFDYIHSVDNLKLAEKISKEQTKQKKKIKIFIQINIGDEYQKSGIHIDDIGNFCKTVDFFRLTSGQVNDKTFHHVGIYAFTNKALIRYVMLERSKLELERNLEQL